MVDNTLPPQPAPPSYAGAPAPRGDEKNWMGIAALITGVVGMGLVALILGILGVKAAKRGQADNRALSIAGIVLGIIEIVAAIAVVVVVLLLVDAGNKATTDAAAETDIQAVAYAAIDYGVDVYDPPTISGRADDGTYYLVGGIDGSDWTPLAPMTLETNGSVNLTVNADDLSDVCFQMFYPGGHEGIVSYSWTRGVSHDGCYTLGYINGSSLVH